MYDPQQFEKDVRRIARYRWPAAELSGTEMFAGRERDGIFITEDCVHLVEATAMRDLEKTRKDLAKLHELYKHYKKGNPEYAIKCWLITLFEPTGDQRAARKEIKNVPDNLFNVVSFAQFQSKLIDSHEYLQNRETHKFGSIYNPRTGSATGPIDYVEIGMRSDDGTMLTTAKIADSLLTGERFAIVGEYGVGKSMTLKELFTKLARCHRESRTPLFPLYINLREHQGQQEPAEILERHGRNIGFRNPSQLVRAWKAGYTVLLIDGFDEVSSMGLQGAWRRLKEARNASMTGVRRLITDTPNGCGIVVAGRENFFDTEQERRQALGQGQAWKDIRLDEFTEEQIKKLVENFGFKERIPSWVPSRPLLLTTLFAKGISPDTAKSLLVLEDSAVGWDLLLQEVSNREARIEQGVTGGNVRAILESLATLARTKEGGIGPLLPDDILGVFQSECGFAATDEALIVLQRLPGLGRETTTTSEDGARCFVDIEFADALRAGDLVRFCLQPFDEDISTRLAKTQSVVGATGVAIAAHKLGKDGFQEGNLTAAIKAIDRIPNFTGAIAGDLVQIALRLGVKIHQPIQVSRLLIDLIELDDTQADLSNVTYTDCYINRLEIHENAKEATCPRFSQCLIQVVDGRVSTKDLPEGCLVNCIVEQFVSSSATNSAALDLQIPVGARVLITVLKKLFAQSLGGRKENGLYRGLDSIHRVRVPEILALLKSQSLIVESGRPGEPIWMPVRRARSRVLGIIASPAKSDDPVMVAARKI